MNKEEKYLDINKALWNAKTEHHVNSDFYKQKEFLSGRSSLNAIELALLGDIKGKSILHLQCHFGQDTISLDRLGAHATGVDFSDKAINAAMALAKETGSGASFICCDVYSLPAHLDQTFDIVYTSYGTIGWLPDLGKWAEVIAHFLKPGGRFIFVEFHPVVWMMDYDFEKIGYHYFNAEAIIETESGTYADREAPIRLESVSWNHGIGEVLNSLIQKGIEINSFEEFDYSPYNCFSHAVESEPGKFRISHLGKKIPMVYALSATRKG